MKTYRIQANAIDTTYKGDSEDEALDNYAKDAGYKDYSDLIDQHGEIDSIEEITE
ncbi:MAG: hypothetical protein JJU13_17450 [Balneolaceae bacterium]|nr:hypothetical protein [Balneolaceae bacterium]